MTTDLYDRRLRENPPLADLLDQHNLSLPQFLHLIQVLRQERLDLAGVVEHVPGIVTGAWRDIVNQVPGPWHENLVVNSFAILLTALCKTGRTPTYSGITHMALGTGDPSWDSGGFPTPLVTDATLVAELARKTVTVDDIDSTNAVVTTGPTGRLLLSATFNLNEAMGDIREFGLWGGRAAAGHTLDEANQGLMVDHINHAKITKSVSSDFTFTRQVRLIF